MNASKSRNSYLRTGVLAVGVAALAFSTSCSSKKTEEVQEGQSGTGKSSHRLSVPALPM